jgi:hypothetical protein
LIRCRPSLARRLVYAPPEAIHAIAAYLHSGVSADLSEIDLAELIEATHPKELLRVAYPEIPPALYRALRHSSDSGATTAETYSRAARLAVGPFADAFLRGCPIDFRRQQHYDALAIADPMVAAMYRALPIDAAIVDALTNVFALLRAQGVILDNYELPGSAGPRGAMRYLLRFVDDLRAPALPFALPLPYVQIASVGELRMVGREFQNCVHDKWHGPRFWIDCATGEDALIFCEAPKLLARLRAVGGGLYTISEVAGPKNSSIDQAVRQSFVAVLRHAGAKIISDEPARSLAKLLNRLGHVGCDGGAEPDFADLALDV